MARIIRTNPKTKSKVSLRVIFSFLLFMQIQLPNAREIREENFTDYSSYLTPEKTQHICLHEKESEIPVNFLALKAN